MSAVTDPKSVVGLVGPQHVGPQTLDPQTLDPQTLDPATPDPKLVAREPLEPQSVQDRQCSAGFKIGSPGL